MIQELLRIWAKERDPVAWRVLADAVEEQFGDERREEVLEELRRSVDRDIERSQLEEVVREQGNLETKPWRVRRLHQDEPYHSTAGAPEQLVTPDNVLTWPGREFNVWLWMDFPPEYLQRDLERASEDTGTFRTIYTTGGGFQDREEEYLLDVKTQEVWRRVADNAHGAETECPFTTWNIRFRLPDLCRIEETWYGEHPNKKCRFCGERIGEPHRYIYVGEGSETVYEMLEGEEQREVDEES